MVAMPLAHLSWAIADNTDRKPCDHFFQEVFGAEPVFEILIDPANDLAGLDREETLMIIGDSMIIPIAPAGASVQEGSPAGDMLRRSAAPMRWLGVALRVDDLKSADKWFTDRGFKLHYDRGMEEHYFLVGRGQMLGLRLELLCHGLPNDPREDESWTPAKWRDDHPLGIEGLQAIGLSAPTLGDAREVFAGKMDWPEIGARYLPADDADCAAFAMGDTVLEAMQGRDNDGAVARHARDTKGIYSITYKVKDAGAAAEYLRGKGLELIGDVADRIAIAPEQAHGRLIWLTDKVPEAYPAAGSKLREPASF